MGISLASQPMRGEHTIACCQCFACMHSTCEHMLQILTVIVHLKYSITTDALDAEADVAVI